MVDCADNVNADADGVGIGGAVGRAADGVPRPRTIV